VHEKIGPKFNFDFYKMIFELLLRLKVSLYHTTTIQLG
jgi:hypothetical protein